MITWLIMHWSRCVSCTDHMTAHELITWMLYSDQVTDHALITWLIMHWSRGYHALISWLIMHWSGDWSCTDHVADHALITWLSMQWSRVWMVLMRWLIKNWSRGYNALITWLHRHWWIFLTVFPLLPWGSPLVDSNRSHRTRQLVAVPIQDGIPRHSKRWGRWRLGLQGQTEETRHKVTMHVFVFFFGFTKCEACEILVPDQG